MHTHRTRFAASLSIAFCTLTAGLLTGCQMMTGYTMNQRGTAYFDAGNYSVARNEFQRAVIDDPDNPNYLHNLATAMRKQGDLDAAEQTYRKSLDLRPSHQPSYHGLATLLKEQGREAEAVYLMERWAGTQPYSPEPYIETAWIKREMGDISGAEQALQQALKVQPNHPTALAHLGQIYQDGGQPDRAVAMFQRSLRNDWHQPQVRSRLAALRGNRLPSRSSLNFSSPPVARYGSTQRLGQLYPLPTYGSPAIAQSSPGIIASQPILLGQPEFADADPAHAPQLSFEIPAVAPH